MTPLSIAFLLTVFALVVVLGAAVGRAPLWVAVLLLIVAHLLMLAPSGPFKW